MHNRPFKIWLIQIFISSMAVLSVIMLPLPALCQSSALPSPATLLESWKQLDSDFTASVHSYHLAGTVTPSSTYLKTWNAINSGNRFLWWFDSNNGFHKFSKNNQAFDMYSIFPPSNGVGIHSQIRGANMDSFLKHIYAYCVPYRIEDLIRNPTLTCNPEAYLSNIPLYDYYKSFLFKMHTVGTDTINNWKCFHVQIESGYRSNEPFLLRDIWFAEINNHFNPVQFYIYDLKGTTRSILTYTKLQQIGTAWVPVEYNKVTELLGSTPTGKKNWHRNDAGHVYTLQFSEINTEFPDDTFQVTYPKNTELYLNDEPQGISTRPITYGKSLFAGSAIRCLLIVVALMIIFVWMARGSSLRRS